MQLKDWLKKTNMTQQMLAEKLLVAPVTVHRWVQHKKRPGKMALRAIHKITRGEVTTDDFLTRKTCPTCGAFVKEDP